MCLASELQSWLLYYSLLVLKDVLPERYFNHYSLLVLSIFILLSNNISQTELQVAESCLHHFYEDYSSLFGMHVFYMQSDTDNTIPSICRLCFFYHERAYA